MPTINEVRDRARFLVDAAYGMFNFDGKSTHRAYGLWAQADKAYVNATMAVDARTAATKIGLFTDAWSYLAGAEDEYNRLKRISGISF